MNLAADSGEGQQDPYTREVLEGERDRAVPVQTAYDLWRCQPSASRPDWRSLTSRPACA